VCLPRPQAALLQIQALRLDLMWCPSSQKSKPWDSSSICKQKNIITHGFEKSWGCVCVHIVRRYS
jgi:hypothetical protein